MDRFCEGCAYNLRTLPVVRDAHTGIPVVRCPECGRLQPANDASTALRPWLNRVTAMLLWVWVLTIISCFFWLGVAETALSYSTLDELTIRSGSKVQRIGNTTIRTWSGSGPLEVNKDFDEPVLFVGMVLGVSTVTAFVFGLFAVVTVPHWPRVAYVLFVLVIPIICGAIVAACWRYDAPHLLNWAVPYMLAHAGAQVLGGVLGVLFGRPFARLIVRIFLPSSVRPRLAYLWLADGKPAPTR